MAVGGRKAEVKPRAIRTRVEAEKEHDEGKEEEEQAEEKGEGAGVENAASEQEGERDPFVRPDGACDVFISLRYAEAEREGSLLAAALKQRGISAYMNKSQAGMDMFSEIADMLVRVLLFFFFFQLSCKLSIFAGWLPLVRVHGERDLWPQNTVDQFNIPRTRFCLGGKKTLVPD